MKLDEYKSIYGSEDYDELVNSQTGTQQTAAGTAKLGPVGNQHRKSKVIS